MNNLQLSHPYRKALTAQRDIIHGFVDFKKTFDGVWHKGLCTLCRYSASKRASLVIKALYNSSVSAVLVNDQMFLTTEVNKGDRNLMADASDQLQSLNKGLSVYNGMETSTDKSNVMVNTNGNSKAGSSIKRVQIEEANSFRYLGTTLSKDGSYFSDRIVSETAAMTSLTGSGPVTPSG